MTYGFGVILGILSIISGMYFLNQPLGQFFDAVALSVVLGGTVAVGVVVLPWEYAQDVLRAFGTVVFPFQRGWKSVLRDCMAFVQNVNAGTAFKPTLGGLPGAILREGQELIELKFSRDEIETILRERVEQSGDRARLVAEGFRGLAKYPPAFGLAGTVLGLVSLMRAITEGMATRETGVRMAIALVATFYGLVLANLIVAPLGESTMRRAATDRQRGLIALQAVLLAAERTSLLKAQEMLNSYVPARKRIDFIKIHDSSSDEGKQAA